LEVLQALHRQPYDVVLMDVQMPEMDGLTATRRICQEWSQSQRPRIIAMTANAMQGDREVCIDAGMDDYVSKPIRVEELVQALSKCQTGSVQGSAIKDRATAKINNGQQKMDKTAIEREALESLREMAGENASEMLIEVIDSYLEDAPKLLHTISTAIAQGDAAALRQAAHTLNSTSATLGATTLSKFCKELEATGRAGTVEGALERLPQLAAESERVKAALQVERQQCQDEHFCPETKRSSFNPDSGRRQVDADSVASGNEKRRLPSSRGKGWRGVSSCLRAPPARHCAAGCHDASDGRLHLLYPTANPL
jgi:CheY-like chemotaxis protein/HPt (histidine-containing phosphotransfer) domain-containing protein